MCVCVCVCVCVHHIYVHTICVYIHTETQHTHIYILLYTYFNVMKLSEIFFLIKKKGNLKTVKVLRLCQALPRRPCVP